MKKLNDLKEELSKLKEINFLIATEYGRELSTGDMRIKEEILEKKIRILENHDTTMYLVIDEDYLGSFKKADSVAVYSSSVGVGIHFEKPSNIYSDKELISSDSKKFWDIINTAASGLSSEINNLEYKLHDAKRNQNLIEKAYKRRED